MRPIRSFLAGLAVVIAAGVGIAVPLQQTEAHIIGCVQTARDSHLQSIAGFNYGWLAQQLCSGDADYLYIQAWLQEYNWRRQRWESEAFLAAESESNDDFLMALGVRNVPPYLGVNCRRVKAYFTVQEDGRENRGIIRSNGECY